MTRKAVIAAMIGMTALAGGCQRLNYGAPVAPLPAVPDQPVASGGSLQPLVLGPDPNQPPPLAGATPGAVPGGVEPQAGGVPIAGGQVAAVDPAAASTGQNTAVIVTPQEGAQIGRTDLLGGWTISAAGESCKLFMNLTTWSGGYRASTRGCALPSLAQIAAWDLNGAQVVLKDSAGGDLAHLYKSAPERFNGQTTAGQGVAFYR